MPISLPKTVRNLLAICSVAIWIGVFVQSVRDFTNYPVSDLRNRVTGARRLAEGIDPYLWPDASLQERYRAFSPTSVSPAQLLLYWPLRDSSYERQRTIYFALDWVLVAGCLAQLLKLAPASLPRMPTFLIISIFFLLDNSLRLHFARGQTYLLLLFLTVVVATEMRRRDPGWFGPLAFSLLLLFRPTYALAAIAAMLAGHKQLLVRTTAMLLIVGAVAVAATGVTPWLEYTRFVVQQTHEHLSLVASRKSAPASTVTIEGIYSRRFLSLNGYVQDQTSLGLSGQIGVLRTLMLKHPRAAMVVNSSLLLSCAFLGLFVVCKASELTSSYLLTAWIFLLPFDLETFGPQRYPYSDVLLVLPAAMLMFAVLQRRTKSHTRLLAAFAILTAISALLSRTPFGPVALITTVRFLVVVFALNGACVVGLFSDSRTSEMHAAFQSESARS